MLDIGLAEMFLMSLIIVISIGSMISFVFYLLTLQKALRLVTPQNRLMKPAFVWLNLIPIFSLGWLIYTVIKVSKSIKREFVSKGIANSGEGGFGIGLASAILFVLANLPYIGILFFLAGFICLVIYWIIVARYNRKMVFELGLTMSEEGSAGIDIVSKIFLALNLFGLCILSFYELIIRNKFMAIFKEMNVGLPFLMRVSSGIYLTIFSVVAVALILKEIVIKKKSIAMIINVIMYGLILIAIPIIVVSNFMPLFSTLKTISNQEIEKAPSIKDQAPIKLVPSPK